MIVAFTGHRPLKIGGYDIPNPIYDTICAEIKKTLLELKPDQAISGMALGVDQWAAEICVELKIPFTAAIPCFNQDRKWPATSQYKYRKLLKLAEHQVTVTQSYYTHEVMQARNEWMVDNSDILIAVWNGTPGGTANCVKYAQKQGKRIIRIRPPSSQ